MIDEGFCMAKGYDVAGDECPPARRVPKVPREAEEDEIFRDLYCVSFRSRPGATDEGENQNGRRYGRNEYKFM